MEVKTADDYRVINGVPYPFQHETRHFGPNGETSRRRIEVQSARINLPPDEIDLTLFVPACGVTDLVHGVALTLRAPRTLTTESRPTLAEELGHARADASPDTPPRRIHYKPRPQSPPPGATRPAGS